MPKAIDTSCQVSLDASRARFAAGLVSGNAVTRAEVEYATAEQGMVQTQGQVESTYLELGYLPKVNPTGPTSGRHRVLRGGGWNNRAAFLRSSNRHDDLPEFRSPYLGFRCASDKPPDVAPVEASQTVAIQNTAPPPEDPRKLPKPYSPLPECARSRLHQGDWVFMSYGGGHNDIRSTPDTHPSDNVIGEAQEGELLLIVGGPECNYGWILWEVQTANGIRGWTPESDGVDFWIEPFPGWKPCPSSPPSDLVVGEHALVSPFPPDANKLRQQPGTGGEQIGTILPGERVDILEGPVCEDNFVWWWIRSLKTGLEGWTAEGRPGADWLIPVPEK